MDELEGVAVALQAARQHHGEGRRAVPAARAADRDGDVFAGGRLQVRAHGRGERRDERRMPGVVMTAART